MKAEQAFTPSTTDLEFPHFVCWDTEPVRNAAHEARFSSQQDAKDFFEIKKLVRPELCVWRGVLGRRLDNDSFDWMHIEWSPARAEQQQIPTDGEAYAWSDWKKVRYKACKPEA